MMLESAVSTTNIFGWDFNPSKEGDCYDFNPSQKGNVYDFNPNQEGDCDFNPSQKGTCDQPCL